MNHFITTLPSDSSEKYFPDNTVAHFTCRFLHRIRLDGDYEVGLAEFIYPYSWFNFTNADNVMHAHVVKTESGEIFAMCSFPSGQYANEVIFAKGLTDKLAEVIVLTANRKDLRAIFKYDEVFKKMTFTVRCDDDSEAFSSPKICADCLVLLIVDRTVPVNTPRKIRTVLTTDRICCTCTVT